MDHDPARYARISALVEREFPVNGDAGGRAGALERLCTVVAREVSAVGAGMTLLVRDAPSVVVAASDGHAEQLEELQVVLGEGPCVDAVTVRRPVFETDLGGRGAARWPAYAPAVQALDVGAVFAFPLQVGGVCAGALDVYRTRSESMSTANLLDVLTFADVGLSMLLDDQQGGAERRPWENLDGARTPAELYQAQGMVMVQLGITLGAAMARIRAHAYAHDQRLAEVARDIIAGNVVLTRDDHGDGTSPVG